MLKCNFEEVGCKGAAWILLAVVGDRYMLVLYFV